MGGGVNVIGTNAAGSAIGGGYYDQIANGATFAIIAGGYYNRIGANAECSAIAGGGDNDIGADSNHSTIGGGKVNNIASHCTNATIAGGRWHYIGVRSHHGTIGGGNYNQIANGATFATIAGGNVNLIGPNSGNGAVGGGYHNYIAANSYNATIPGGRDNAATNNAFAAGCRAKAVHEGAFVWGDSNDEDFTSTGNNQFLIRAARVGIGTNAPAAKLDVHQSDSGVVALKANNSGSTNYALIGGSWYGVYGYASSPSSCDFYAGGPGVDYGSSSSQRWKRHVQPIDQPLEKLAALRGVSFNWDAEHGGHHDVGMIAEEVGAVLPEIVTYEPNGVDAVAMDYSRLAPLLVEAAKALEQRVAGKEAKIADLQKRLEKLERLLARPNGGTR